MFARINAVAQVDKTYQYLQILELIGLSELNIDGELNRLRRDCNAAILAAYVSHAGETPAVQIQFPIRSSYAFGFWRRPECQTDSFCFENQGNQPS
jgi:hypothetical protein